MAADKMQRRPESGDREEKGWRPVVQNPSQKPVTPPTTPASTAPTAKVPKK